MIEEQHVPTWKDRYDESQLENLKLKEDLAASKQANKDEVAALVKEIHQCWNDIRYACRCFGQSDWLMRRHEELANFLSKYGMEVPRKL